MLVRRTVHGAALGEVCATNSIDLSVRQARRDVSWLDSQLALMLNLRLMMHS
jgi:hypothetical protein